MGEIFWKNIITTSNNEKWNYDISPEFIFHNGITIDSRIFEILKEQLEVYEKNANLS